MNNMYKNLLIWAAELWPRHRPSTHTEDGRLVCMACRFYSIICVAPPEYTPDCACHKENADV